MNTANAVVSRQHLANGVEDDALVEVVPFAATDALVAVVVVVAVLAEDTTPVPLLVAGGHWPATAFVSATSKSSSSSSSSFVQSRQKPYGSHKQRRH